MTKTRGPLAFSQALCFTMADLDSFIKLLLALEMEEEATNQGMEIGKALS